MSSDLKKSFFRKLLYSGFKLCQSKLWLPIMVLSVVGSSAWYPEIVSGHSRHYVTLCCPSVCSSALLFGGSGGWLPALSALLVDSLFTLTAQAILGNSDIYSRWLGHPSQNSLDLGISCHLASPTPWLPSLGYQPWGLLLQGYFISAVVIPLGHASQFCMPSVISSVPSMMVSGGVGHLRISAGQPHPEFLVWDGM